MADKKEKDVKKDVPAVTDRTARIKELESHQGSAAELLDLKIEEYTENRDALEKERGDVVVFATQLKELANGGPGSVEIPLVLKNNPDNPKASTKQTTTVDATLLRGAGGDNAKRLLNQLADLFIQSKHEAIQIFEAENEPIRSEIQRRKNAPVS